MDKALRRRDEFHRAENIGEVAVFREHFKRFIPIARVSGHSESELQTSREFSAVELTIVDCRREPVYVFRIPTAPKRRLAVNVYQVQVMPQDVLNHPNIIGRQASAF